MENMGYILLPLYGKHGLGKYTLVDDDYDGEYFGQFKWYVSPGGYVVRDGRPEGINGYIYLHQEVQRVPKGFVSDHIDRNKLNNRSCNLRIATFKLNALNRTGGLPEYMTDEERRNIRRQKANKIVSNPEYKKRKKEYDKIRYLTKKKVLPV